MFCGFHNLPCSLPFLNLVHAFFQETVDHMLYPNPGSGMVHDQHLQFFHFLGTLLAKVCFHINFINLAFFFIEVDFPSLKNRLMKCFPRFVVSGYV